MKRYENLADNYQKKRISFIEKIFTRFDIDEDGYLKRNEAHEFFAYIYDIPLSKRNKETESILRTIMFKAGIRRDMAYVSWYQISVFFTTPASLQFIDCTKRQGEEAYRRITSG